MSGEGRMSALPLKPTGKDRPKGLRSLRPRVNPAFLILVLLMAGITWYNPNFLEPAGLMNFLRRAAPLAVLTCGQLFVLVTGGFDLSAGALVTLTVIGASLITMGDPAMAWPAVAALYGIALAVGIANGLIVHRLKVPSIIATLGMLLLLTGTARAWSGGSPRGYLPENFRAFGRLVWHNMPLVHILPVAVLVLAAVVAIAGWLLHGTNFGKLALAIGDNARSAELAGAPVGLVRVAAFVLSALSAVTAGILLGGFAGVSLGAGDGMELQAIAAAVIGGTRLLGGRGTVAGAVAGALTLYALFTLLNLLGLPQPVRESVQGVILIAAAAVAWRQRRQA
jgi:ribose transport system permease protein